MNRLTKIIVFLLSLGIAVPAVAQAQIEVKVKKTKKTKKAKKAAPPVEEPVTPPETSDAQTTSAPTMEGTPTSQPTMEAPTSMTTTETTVQSVSDQAAALGVLPISKLRENVDGFGSRLKQTQSQMTAFVNTVLHGSLGGVLTVIRQKGSYPSLELTDVVYKLDGKEVFSKKGVVSPELDIYQGNLKPGSHTLTVSMSFRSTVRGGGPGQTSTIEKTHSIDVQSGRQNLVIVEPFEKKSFFKANPGEWVDINFLNTVLTAN